MSIPLFLQTFNCAKSRINAADFSAQIQHALPESPAHLYVFGFQEVCSILDASFSVATSKHVLGLNRNVLHALKTKYNDSGDAPLAFTTIGVHHIGAIAIIAVTPYALKFGPCKFAAASCGNGHSLLKGAAGIRVSYTSADSLRTELTFGVAHLSAYEGTYYYERRLQNIQTLMRALDFGDGYSFLKPDTHAFFMGDLNFRTIQDPKNSRLTLEELMETQDPVELSKSTSIQDLVARYDELTHGRINGEVFSGFDEACITFRPTYKYHINTAIYSAKRCPLWCDRILYQSTYKKGTAPVVLEYNCIASYLGSDHRPVYLQITVPLEAPESIIGPNGYLVVLPVASHLAHNKQIKEFDPNSSVSGPTQVYMKFSAIDTLNQKILRKLADSAIGNGLWLGTTANGRITILVLTLLAWVVYAI